MRSRSLHRGHTLRECYYQKRKFPGALIVSFNICIMFDFPPFSIKEGKDRVLGQKIVIEKN